VTDIADGLRDLVPGIESHLRRFPSYIEGGLNDILDSAGWALTESWEQIIGMKSFTQNLLITASRKGISILDKTIFTSVPATFGGWSRTVIGTSAWMREGLEGVFGYIPSDLAGFAHWSLNGFEDLTDIRGISNVKRAFESGLDVFRVLGQSFRYKLEKPSPSFFAQFPERIANTPKIPIAQPNREWFPIPSGSSIAEERNSPVLEVVAEN
jgi:hypothetical protein